MSSTVYGKDVKDGMDTEWFLIDGANQVLGRLASKIAMMLMGKHKPEFTRQVLMGDQIIVTNAAKIRVTGRKLQDKTYDSYSGYPGGLKTTNLETMIKKKPTFPLEHAVKGMLPKSNLGIKMSHRLHIYVDESHPHKAQKPQELKVS